MEKLKIKFFVLLSSLIALPSYVFAQVSGITNEDVTIPGGLEGYNLQKLIAAGNGLINIIVSIILALSVIFIMLGGFKWVTSGGEPDKIKTAKSQLLYGVIGIAIIILAGTIWSFVASIL